MALPCSLMVAHNLGFDGGGRGSDSSSSNKSKSTTKDQYLDRFLCIGMSVGCWLPFLFLMSFFFSPFFLLFPPPLHFQPCQPCCLHHLYAPRQLRHLPLLNSLLLSKLKWRDLHCLLCLVFIWLKVIHTVYSPNAKIYIFLTSNDIGWNFVESCFSFSTKVCLFGAKQFCPREKKQGVGQMRRMDNWPAFLPLPVDGNGKWK